MDARTLHYFDALTLRRVAFARLLGDISQWDVLSFAGSDDASAIGSPETLAMIHLGAAGFNRCEWAQRVVAHVFSAAPRAMIVALSDREDSADVSAALSAGLRGYLTTDMSPELIQAAFQVIEAGGVYAPATALIHGSSPNPLHDSATEPKPNLGGGADLPVPLTMRQREVLALMRRGCANKEIAFRLHMKESTVKVHVRNIMRKMSVSNRTQAAFYAGQFVG